MQFSVFIPRVHSSLDWRAIKETFEELFGVNSVARVDLLKPRLDEADPVRSKPTSFSRAYVHFKDESSIELSHVFSSFKEKLLQGESVKIVYQDPYYWLCLINKATKKKRSDITKTVPYIQFNQLNDSISTLLAPLLPTRQNTTTTVSEA